MLIISVILFILVDQSLCSSIAPEEYLLKYGYVSVTPRTKSQLSHGVKLFQQLFGLPVTGKIDAQTKEAMARPRCGNSDPVYKVSSRNIFMDPPRDDKGKGYNLQGSKWTNNRLTYRIKEKDFAADTYWSEKIDGNSTLRIIKFSFDVWSAVTPLQFKYVDEKKRKVHTRFQFSARLHCCHISSPHSSQFDGNGGTIAHAEYPQFGGDVHVDEDEEFLAYAPDQRGHTLGLEHVWDSNSIMYPEYKKLTSGNYLSAGDIAGVRAMYGNKTLKLNGDFKLIIP